MAGLPLHPRLSPPTGVRTGSGAGLGSRSRSDLDQEICTEDEGGCVCPGQARTEPWALLPLLIPSLHPSLSLPGSL